MEAPLLLGMCAVANYMLHTVMPTTIELSFQFCTKVSFTLFFKTVELSFDECSFFFQALSFFVVDFNFFQISLFCLLSDKSNVCLKYVIWFDCYEGERDIRGYA